MKTNKILQNAVLLSLTAFILNAEAADSQTTTSAYVDSGGIVLGGNNRYTLSSSISATDNKAYTGFGLWVEGVGNQINISSDITRSNGQAASGTSTYGATGIMFGEYTVSRYSSTSTTPAGIADTITPTVFTGKNLSLVGSGPLAGLGLAGTNQIILSNSTLAGGLARTTAGSSYVNITTASQLIGKTIRMNGEVVDGEAREGENAKIIAYDPATGVATVNKYWTGNQAGNGYNILAGTGNNVLNNNATVIASVTSDTRGGTFGTPTVKALTMNTPGNFIINNYGTLRATNILSGTTNAIDVGGDVTEITINNTGTITASRVGTGSKTGIISLTTNTYDYLRGSIAGTSSLITNIGNGAAVYSQEEAEKFTLTNSRGATILGEGSFMPAFYLRASEQNITNSGDIIGSRIVSDGSYSYGMAIGAVSDGGEIRTFNLTNNSSGLIRGDILGVNSNAYRWYALSNFNADGTTNPAAAGINNRLITNSSNWGQLDSNITNAGTITGNLYFSNGEHVITNTGTITGNIDLDQRDTRTAQIGNAVALTTASSSIPMSAIGAGPGGAPGSLGANTIQTHIVKTVTTAGSKSQAFTPYELTDAQAGTYYSSVTGLTAGTTVTHDALTSNADASSTAYTGLFRVVGDKEFTFNNQGTFTGNILAYTQESSALGADNTKTSEITLAPTIRGAGGADANSANSSNINYFNGDLIIVNSGGGKTSHVTIAPKAADGVIIRDDEFYKISNSLKVGTAYGSYTTYNNTSYGALATANALSVGEGNGLVEWTLSVNASGALVAQAETHTSTVASQIQNIETRKAFTALMSGDSIAGSSLQNLTTNEEVLAAAERLRPGLNGAHIQANMGMTDKLNRLVENRLSEIRVASLTGRRGIASGQQPNGVGVWLEGIGGRGDQDRRNGVDGYKTNQYGLALGADAEISRQFRLGGAVSFAQSNINDQGATLGNRTDIDSYQASLYASRAFDKWYLNSSLGLGRHNHTSKRYTLGGLASGSYGAWQYTAKVDAGYPLQVGAFTFTPIGSLTYSRLNQAGYNESGVGALNINSRDIDSFKSGLGLKATIPLFNEGEYKATLQARTSWTHEFGNVDQDTTASFAGVGTNFTTNGVKVARDGLNLGASLIFANIDEGIAQNLSFSYDADLRSQYLNHTARVQARFDF